MVFSQFIFLDIQLFFERIFQINLQNLCLYDILDVFHRSQIKFLKGWDELIFGRNEFQIYHIDQIFNVQNKFFNNIIKINLKSKKTIKFAKYQTYSLMSMLFLNKTNSLISGGNKHSVCFYNANSNKLKKKIHLNKEQITIIFFKDNYVYIGTDSCVFILCIYKMEIIKILNIYHPEFKNDFIKNDDFTYWMSHDNNNFKIFQLSVSKKKNNSFY